MGAVNSEKEIIEIKEKIGVRLLVDLRCGWMVLYIKYVCEQ